MMIYCTVNIDKEQESIFKIKDPGIGQILNSMVVLIFVSINFNKLASQMAAKEVIAGDRTRKLIRQERNQHKERIKNRRKEFEILRRIFQKQRQCIIPKTQSFILNPAQIPKIPSRAHSKLLKRCKTQSAYKESKNQKDTTFSEQPPQLEINGIEYNNDKDQQLEPHKNKKMKLSNSVSWKQKSSLFPMVLRRNAKGKLSKFFKSDIPEKTQAEMIDQNKGQVEMIDQGNNQVETIDQGQSQVGMIDQEKSQVEIIEQKVQMINKKAKDKDKRQSKDHQKSKQFSKGYVNINILSRRLSQKTRLLNQSRLHRQKIAQKKKAEKLGNNKVYEHYLHKVIKQLDEPDISPWLQSIKTFERTFNNC